MDFKEWKTTGKLIIPANQLLHFRDWREGRQWLEIVERLDLGLQRLAQFTTSYSSKQSNNLVDFFGFLLCSLSMEMA